MRAYIVRGSLTTIAAVVAFIPMCVTGQSLSGIPLSCVAGSPPGNQLVPGLLSSLEPNLNGAWAAQAPKKIDPYPWYDTAAGATPVDLVQNDIPIACNSSLNQYCSFYYSGGSCLNAHGDVTLNALTGLKALRFSSLTASSFNLKDVAAHSDRGPDASKITDGVLAPEGHPSTDPAYAIVLTHSPNDLRVAQGTALVIDLGKSYSVCGNGFDCKSGPMIQADNDDNYQLDYSLDGVNWTKYGVFPSCCSDGLHTRGISTITSGVHNPSFQAQYVRVYGISGGATYAVSELQLWDTGSNLISVGKHAVGPRPYQITDGVFAPEGHSSTDTQYAVVLRHLTGPAAALAIDLGEVKSLCGNGREAACTSGPIIQADNDDVYQLDYSSDGMSWIELGQFPSVSGSGLRTRGIVSPSGGSAEAFKARYVRVFAVSGGNTFAVSEVQLEDTAGNPASLGAATYGPEPVVIDGELAPDGTDYNDGNFANILPSCQANASSICPPSAASSSAQTAALQIDLGGTFPIDHLVVQADQAHEFEIDASTDDQNWSFFSGVPEVSGHGLQQRTIGGSGRSVRYLRLFGLSGASDSYSVSGVQAFTAQANTPCTYDSGANAGENFACGYDGAFAMDFVAPASNGTVPIGFNLKSATIRVECERTDQYGVTTTDSFTVSDASGRTCTDSLQRTSGVIKNAGYCAGFCASGQNHALLSYAQLATDPQSNDEQIKLVPTTPTSIACSDQGSIESGILPLTDNVVAGVASGVAQGFFNGLLDYRAKPASLLPFPPPTSQTTPPWSTCPTTTSAPPPPTPSPDNIAGLEGRATQVGAAKNSGTLHISGRFAVQNPVALDQAALTVNALLHEFGGAGELVRGSSDALLVPLSLQPQNGSEPDKGLYTTPPGAQPAVRAQVAPVKGQSGLMDFAIDVDRASILSPSRCAGGSAIAPLGTSFLLIGRAGEPVRVHATANWQCNGSLLITSLDR
ncbi:MAG: hypothetical protein E6H48_02830 [Betaproteobacteria bacterium]|nr:MAG: hypothetical protein E6H48_02830 [Betaproteobacteria bacterium]